MENNTKGAGDDYPIIPQPLHYKCAGCGTVINEGEFKTFGVCDACWDKGVTEKYWGPKKEHVYTDKEIIKLAENEIESLRKELASLKEENAKLKFRADLMAIYKQEKEDRDKILHQIKCTLYDRLTETEKLNDILKFFPTALKTFSDNK